MSLPNDQDATFVAELAALVPAAPSSGLRRRVAAALAAPPLKRPARARWLVERLVWACGGAAAGAVAATLAFGVRPVTSPVAALPQAGAGAAPVVVAEESVAWADEGVKFLDDRTPARVLRRVTVERRLEPGGSEVRVPREDLILLPVVLR